MQTKRRAISPIIATLLLIAIAVGAGVVVYVFTTGLTGSLTQSGGQQVGDELSMDAYAYSQGTSLTVYVRNVGSGTVTIDSSAGLFFNGQVVSDQPSSHPGGTSGSCYALSTSYQLTPGTVCWLYFNGSAVTGAASGASNQVKLVTKDGGTFLFNVVAGRSG